MSREPFGIDVALALAPGTDPRAPGGEVTVELCGHWEHDGPCRWPHNSRIDTDADPAHLRTVVVAPAADHADIARRLEAALRQDQRWSVVRFTTGPVTHDERALADRLAASLG